MHAAGVDTVAAVRFFVRLRDGCFFLSHIGGASDGFGAPAAPLTSMLRRWPRFFTAVVLHIQIGRSVEFLHVASRHRKLPLGLATETEVAS